MRWVAMLAVACVFPATAAVATGAGTGTASLRQFVDATMAPVLRKHQVPGAAVAVTVDGQTYFFNYGVASQETKLPVSESTIFEIGSVSKVFTATLALVAQAKGQLSLADPPSKYRPELKGAAIDKATLLHLGTYTAGGLPLQVPDEVKDDTGMLDYLQHWQPTTPPGAQREYSNPSMGLLGRLSSLALHRDFADAIENEVLRPLSLAHTHVHVPPGAMANYAWGYGKDNKPVHVNPDVFDAETYGIKSTSADMIRFVQLNMDTSNLRAPLRQAVAGTQVGYFQVGPMVQGLGWEQYPYPVSLQRLLEGNSTTMIFEPQPAKPLSHPMTGATLLNKTGSTGGFGAYVAFVPQRRIGIVMLANRSYPIPARVKAAHAILGWLAKHRTNTFKHVVLRDAP